MTGTVRFAPAQVVPSHTARRETAPSETAPLDARPLETQPLETEYQPRQWLDLAVTLGIQRRGAHDPTMTVAGGVFWRASRTPEGVATLALRQNSDGSVRAAAWGPGASWTLAQLPALCGAADDPSGFDHTRHPRVHACFQRVRGLRLSRTDLVFDALAGAIMEQKVTGLQAFGAWRRLVTRYGTRAPGPTPHALYAPPEPGQWRRIPSWGWHEAGLEPAQSRTIVQAAARADAIARTATATHTATATDTATVRARPADDPLTALPGIGPWTTAETRIRALGDPDAVSVGDYHLAHEVGWALTGSRTDDDGMLALLEPWRGHRQRVIRLLLLAGPREPRRGPRLAPEDHRRR